MFENTGNPAIIDEWTFGQYQDSNVVRAKLTEHWDTWITESDFRAIAAAGCVLASRAVSVVQVLVFIFRLNHVRIPIGYWAYDVSPGEPYISGQHNYLLKAIAWAAIYNLKVIVDLHGAPGSQNGYGPNCFPFQLVFSHGFFKFQLRQLWSKVVVPSMAVEASQCRPHECNHKELGVSVQISLSSSLSHFPPQRVRAKKCFVLHHMLRPCSRPAGFYGKQVLDVTRQYWLDSYGSIR